MKEISLDRRDRGRVAEAIVYGLYEEPCKEVQRVIREDLNDRYPSAREAREIKIQEADVNTYTWYDEIPPRLPEAISWRADCVLTAEWLRWIDPEDVTDCDRWELKPASENHMKVGGELAQVKYAFRVYYPIEVKSGKKTLTANQADDIPEIVEHVDDVHPLIANVDLNSLPDAYEISIDVIRTPDWSSSGGDWSRYQ
jgi:hypothetical protein